MKTGLPRHLIITFYHCLFREDKEESKEQTFPSGIFVNSTSTFANAKTSADAVKLAIKSDTVDLAPAAVKRPIDPTMK